ncbi:hypothetical protein JD844_027036 [Phrynosoma platyrhinos]|uniref:Ankyrin repeat domain-containing protein 37 n=1 Tax=Phrynosoma platyrhinos TaxID=52577 RepID=A0ABQ7SFL9_PHRPL|nr:hypothetical protein JD844_027036 [Phrynosoma platyrhinos]
MQCLVKGTAATNQHIARRVELHVLLFVYVQKSGSQQREWDCSQSTASLVGTASRLAVDALEGSKEPGLKVNRSHHNFTEEEGKSRMLLFDYNAEDWLGEAPIHKAAKVGSLECLALLVASRASIDLRNKNGQTAEDLAWDFGFLECAQFLMTVKNSQKRKNIQTLLKANHHEKKCEQRKMGLQLSTKYSE